MNITDFEFHVMNAIAHDEMTPANCDTPQSHDETGCWCWPERYTRDDLDVQQVKGVLSSLVKKGLITISEYDRDDNEVDFTKNGFDVWKTEFEARGLERSTYENRIDYQS